MQYTYGAYHFYYQFVTKQKTIAYKKFKLFGKSEQVEKVVDEEVRETYEEFWDRINNTIKEENLKVINIETIFEAWAGGETWTKISNANTSNGDSKVVGYRVFYKKEAKDPDTQIDTTSGT
jgi:hypothetical protein